MASSWVQGDDLIGRIRRSGGFGTQDAAINSGGDDTVSMVSTVEEYDGSAWATTTSLSAGRIQHDGVGSVLAGLITGGYDMDSYTELNTTSAFDGTSWTQGGNLILGSNDVSIFGGPSATVKAGGKTVGGSAQVEVEEYDGSTWASANSLSETRTEAAATGEATAGLLAGGWESGGGALRITAQEYDGTNWSSGGDLTTCTIDATCFGMLNDALFAGGKDKNDSYYASNICETYDGTSWAQGPLLWKATYSAGYAKNGLKISAMLMGGVTRADGSTSSGVQTTTYFSYEPGPGDPCYIYKADSISIVDLSEIKDLPLIGTIVYGQADSYDEDNGVTFANRWIGGTPDGTGNAEVLLIDSGEDSISGVINIGTGTVTIEQNKYGSGNTLTVYYKTGTTEEACEAASWIEYTEPFISSGFVQCKVEGP